MGIEHAVDASDVGREKLPAQVRSGIHKHTRHLAVRRRADDQDRTAPPVLRIRRIAIAPAGHAAREAASKDRNSKDHAARVMQKPSGGKGRAQASCGCAGNL
jgi:hypothetical protein